MVQLANIGEYRYSEPSQVTDCNARAERKPHLSRILDEAITGLSRNRTWDATTIQLFCFEYTISYPAMPDIKFHKSTCLAVDIVAML